MNKKKVLETTFGIIIGSILAMLILPAIRFIIFIGVLLFSTYWNEDYFVNNIKIKTKEEAFQMILEHQEEYEELVQDMEKLFQESGEEKILILRGRQEYRANGLKDSIAMQYSTYFISAERKDRGLIVSFDFTHPPDSSIIEWGVYYSQNDVPITWWSNVEMTEENGIYSQAGYNYRYEAEKITDNWYYFQERRRSSSDDSSLYKQN